MKQKTTRKRNLTLVVIVLLFLFIFLGSIFNFAGFATYQKGQQDTSSFFSKLFAKTSQEKLVQPQKEEVLPVQSHLLLRSRFLLKLLSKF